MDEKTKSHVRTCPGLLYSGDNLDRMGRGYKLGVGVPARRADIHQIPM